MTEHPTLSPVGMPTQRGSLAAPQRRPVRASECYLAYSLSLLSGLAIWNGLLVVSPDIDPLTNGLLVTTLCTFVIYVFSIRHDNSSIYDPYWVIAPPLLALGVKATSSAGLGAWHLRDLLILFCFLLWATRYHAFYTWEGWREGLSIEDWRYEKMRDFPVPYWLNSLIGMHYFPTSLVYFAFAPAAVVLATPPEDQRVVGVWDVLGTTGAGCGAILAIQTTSAKSCSGYLWYPLPSAPGSTPITGHSFWPDRWRWRYFSASVPG